MEKVNTEKVKTVKGLRGSVATFIRARDKKQIWVFARNGESTDHAIQRVKARNGSSNVQHSLTSN
jgi:hypothetical protein